MQATRSTALTSDINVTPLVDVCLVLLIIFMVVLPTLVTGVPVALPKASTAHGSDGRLLAVTVKTDGTVYLDTLVIRRDELAATLQSLHETASARPIGVRADKAVPYGEVVTVLDACRRAGWEDVTLVAARQGESG